LWHAWASTLEQAGDTRKADAVYVQGIESQAHPVDWLRTQHRYWHYMYRFAFPYLFVECLWHSHLEYTVHFYMLNNAGKNDLI